MATYKNSLPDLLDPAFQEIQSRSEAIPKEYTQFLKTIDSTVYHPKYSAISGIGAAQEAPEGEDIPVADIVGGFDITATQYAYGIGTEVSEDAILFDQFDKIRDQYGFVVKSMDDAIETRAADLFNSGFSTSRTGGDGLQLFSTAHLTEDGSATQSNSASSDFDIAAYRVAKLAFMDQRDGNYRRIAGLFPTTLIVPQAEVMHTAKEILTSTDRADTPNRATNIHNGEVAIKVWRYLTDTDSWYLTNGDHQVYVLWSQRPDHKTEFNARNRITLTNSRMIFALFWKDWRRTYGSAGA